MTVGFISPVFSQIGIGTNTPHESAIVEVSSNSKGVLIPRMTTVERNQIADPEIGLLIFNTNENCIQSFMGNTSVAPWQCVNRDSHPLVTNCNEGEIKGEFGVGNALTNTHKYEITVLNEGVRPKNLIFHASDLEFEPGNSWLSVSGVNPNTTILGIGDSTTISYSLSGTPVSETPFSITWNMNNQSCTSHDTIYNGTANFMTPFARHFASITEPTRSLDFQGEITNGFKVRLPYSGGTGNYGTHKGEFVQTRSGAGEGGDVNGLRLTFPSGDFSSTGFLEAEIEVDGDGVFNVVKQNFNQIDTIAVLDIMVNGADLGDLVLLANGGIPDRNFADAEHRFVYLPIQARDGRTYLTNNLGAQYANASHPNFNPTAMATNNQDFNAYGSMYQFGRYSDGHELATFTNSTTGNGVYGVTNSMSTTITPGHNLKINVDNGNNQVNHWLLFYSSQAHTVWQPGSFTNNPCPAGYRPPGLSEFNNYFSVEGITNAATAEYSSLILPLPGFKGFSNASGDPIDPGNRAYYWTYTYGANYKVYAKRITANEIFTTNFTCSNGFSVRCIKQ